MDCALAINSPITAKHVFLLRSAPGVIVNNRQVPARLWCAAERYGYLVVAAQHHVNGNASYLQKRLNIDCT